MQTRREDMRTAVVLTVASYIPTVVALGCVTDTPILSTEALKGTLGGAWGMAAIVDAMAGFILLVDAALPIGRSKIDMVRGGIRRMRSLLAGRRPGAGVAIAVACMPATHAACEIISNR